MAIVVVGGHTRNIGKTSVVAGLISALREFNWTALKITQYVKYVAHCKKPENPVMAFDVNQDLLDCAADKSEKAQDLVHRIPPIKT